MPELVVVGAGPAGMAAALAAARRGVAVALVDAGSRLGGQYYRQPLDESGGSPPPAGPQLPARFHPVAEEARIELLLGVSVWSASRTGTGFSLLLEGGGELTAPAVVLATGASELVLPFPGWQLPGVVTAGSAQALYKSQHVAIGKRIVVAGSGPFLLPVAATLAEAGAEVLLAEASRPLAAPGALARTFAHPAKLAEGAGYAARLARRRIRFRRGTAVLRCEGDGAVERAVLRRVGTDLGPTRRGEEVVAADAVCVSYGFVPRLELARQLGAREDGPPTGVAPRVAVDPAMATSVPGLFVAGELSGIAGAEVAELEGALAGAAAAGHLGRAGGRPSSSTARRLSRNRAFAALLERLYPVGTSWIGALSDDTVLCRCEQVPWSAVREAVANGAARCRDVRGLTRCGMGYCQGRTCGPALQLALSALTGKSLAEVGDLHKRPVAVPVRLGEVAAGAPGARGEGREAGQ